MPEGHDPNEQTGSDMAAARRRTSFDVTIVRDFLFDGHEKWLIHKKVVDVMSKDGTFDKRQRDFMDRSQRYKRVLRTTDRIYELRERHGWSPAEMSSALSLLDEQSPMVLHSVAFEPVLMSQGSPYLLSIYGPLVANRGILGCYLQTELGHGTNVSGLETTATYIPETKEFEIHSPTLTSTKWWIGALGKTSTHGIVQAKLLLPGGKDLGPHLFFVQLRSLDTHKVLPGVLVGDIGPKAMAGFAPTDNGFARFNHLRIPKEHMLSKFAQVTDDGKYVRPPHAKLSYGGMLYIRSSMVRTGGWLIAKAATASIRYATVRRQGEKGPDGLERQVISYPSVHYRLLPILAHAYVFIQLGGNLTRSFEKMSARLTSGDTSLLAEMHATTSGLKVLVSTTGVQDLEVARRAMGGHGYSAFAGLGRLYADYLPSTTYEGDNFVLDQQVVRAALKSYKALLSSKKGAETLSPSSYYLRLLPAVPKVPLLISDMSWQDPETAIHLLEWRAALLVQERATHVDQSEQDASVNQRVSKAVTEAYVAVQVGEIIRELKMPQREAKIVGDLYRLYLLTTVEAGLVDLLSFGFFHSESTRNDATRGLRMAIAKLCIELYPEAIGLSDAFGFTDWELDSSLGVFDGKVYESLWERAQEEPLNKSEVADGYEEYIKPLLQRGQRLAGPGRSKL